ncbi:SPOSA6832_01929 [Sporobolomyces salmonicolor]|uniref:SPOSA6832_01929-mRNA-1:cds n=1 Tax=Sporidiobolus salmonicolor TaxID=5005 RepID=A0A0D6EJW8_SPOSA|nr:SPOSA6832_01929 [Sporobolomyces salmonicolor]
MLPRTLSRVASAVRPALRPAAATLARPAIRAQPLRLLSTSLPRFEPSALSTKLGEEIKFETENGDASAEPDFLKDFKADGVWKLVDVPGSDEIVLTRTFGNEKYVPSLLPPSRLSLADQGDHSIRLIFSISDLDAEHDVEPYVDEEAADAGSGGVGDESVSPSEQAFPVETSITITKPSGGALTIDAVAQGWSRPFLALSSWRSPISRFVLLTWLTFLDGLFTINNISFYPDADVALGMTSEDDWKRQGLYMGPAFDNLDEGVQSEFEQYLEERGINSALALFIPDLAEWKEQKEYVSWLKGTKEFLEK